MAIITNYMRMFKILFIIIIFKMRSPRIPVRPRDLAGATSCVCERGRQYFVSATPICYSTLRTQVFLRVTSESQNCFF